MVNSLPDNPDTIIHVGLPKAASTSLQQQIFAHLTHCDYHALARKGGPHDESGTFGDIVRLFRESNAIDRDIDRYREWWDETRSSKRENSDSASTRRPALISEERFSTHYGITLALKPAVLREIFGPAHILIIIRDPADLLISTFYQEARHRRYGLRTEPSLTRWIDDALAHADHYLSPAQLIRYDRLADAFAASFGPDKISVLPMEWIADNSLRFATALAHILGGGDEAAFGKALEVRSNVRPRGLPGLFDSGGRTSRTLPALAAAWKTRDPDPALMQRVRGFAAHGVEKIADSFGLPLNDLGYLPT